MSDVQFGNFGMATSIPSYRKRSQLHDIVEQIEGDPSLHKAAHCKIAYDDKTKANSDAVSLRNAYGRKIEDRGFEFAVRKVSVPNPETGEVEEKHGLWIYHDPGRVVPGEWEKHEAKIKEQVAKANAKAAEAKKKQKAAAAKAAKAQ